jgi:hypothetical protein
MSDEGNNENNNNNENSNNNDDIGYVENKIDDSEINKDLNVQTKTYEEKVTLPTNYEEVNKNNFIKLG